MIGTAAVLKADARRLVKFGIIIVSWSAMHWSLLTPTFAGKPEPPAFFNASIAARQVDVAEVTALRKSAIIGAATFLIMSQGFVSPPAETPAAKAEETRTRHNKFILTS